MMEDPPELGSMQAAAASAHASANASPWRPTSADRRAVLSPPRPVVDLLDSEAPDTDAALVASLSMAELLESNGLLLEDPPGVAELGSAAAAAASANASANASPWRPVSAESRARPAAAVLEAVLMNEEETIEAETA